jgi:hypothetical protein
MTDGTLPRNQLPMMTEKELHYRFYETWLVLLMSFPVLLEESLSRREM